MPGNNHPKPPFPQRSYPVQGRLSPVSQPEDPTVSADSSISSMSPLPPAATSLPQPDWQQPQQPPRSLQASSTGSSPLYPQLPQSAPPQTPQWQPPPRQSRRTQLNYRMTFERLQEEGRVYGLHLTQATFGNLTGAFFTSLGSSMGPGRPLGYEWGERFEMGQWPSEEESQGEQEPGLPLRYERGDASGQGQTSSEEEAHVESQDPEMGQEPEGEPGPESESDKGKKLDKGKKPMRGISPTVSDPEHEQEPEGGKNADKGKKPVRGASHPLAEPEYELDPEAESEQDFQSTHDPESRQDSKSKQDPEPEQDPEYEQGPESEPEPEPEPESGPQQEPEPGHETILENEHANTAGNRSSEESISSLCSRHVGSKAIARRSAAKGATQAQPSKQFRKRLEEQKPVTRGRPQMKTSINGSNNPEPDEVGKDETEHEQKGADPKVVGFEQQPALEADQPSNPSAQGASKPKHADETETREEQDPPLSVLWNRVRQRPYFTTFIVAQGICTFVPLGLYSLGMLGTVCLAVGSYALGAGLILGPVLLSLAVLGTTIWGFSWGFIFLLRAVCLLLFGHALDGEQGGADITSTINLVMKLYEKVIA